MGRLTQQELPLHGEWLHFQAQRSFQKHSLLMTEIFSLPMSEERRHINPEILKQEDTDKLLTVKMAKKTKLHGEQKEALMRIIVLIVSGIVLEVWRYFVNILSIINFFYTLFAKQRMKELAEMSEIWNTQYYVFQKYMIFESNFRPFPFNRLQKSISKFEK